MKHHFEDPADITHVIPLLKSGDMVIHLEPKGATANRMKRLGFPAIFGCISDVQEMPEPQIRVFSRLFAATPELADQDKRIIPASDIGLLVVEDAEDYIERESAGRFAYGQNVEVITQNGVGRGTIECYLDEGLVGAVIDGVRAYGSANYFTPVDER